MRLTPEEITAIKAAAAEAFGPDAVVRLFGSRMRDDLDGGDVDLHVEVEPFGDFYDRRRRMEDRLWQDLRYDKIDLLVSQRGGTPRGFERIAYRDGLVL